MHNRRKDMNLTEICYEYRRYASTNPPQNISKTLDLRILPDGKSELEVNEYTNGLTVIKKYAVPKRKVDEVSALFEFLNILSSVSRKFTETVPQDMFAPMMGGGSENYQITFVSNKVSITCRYIPDEARNLVARIKALPNELGNPVFESRSGEDANARYYGAAVPQPAPSTAAVTEEKTAASDPPLGEDEWFCSSCGYRNKGHKFCIECGTVRN